jgi:lipoyl-dependent peroxiredoxin
LQPRCCRRGSGLPRIDRDTAQALEDGAHQVCTYSRATRGNVDVTITVA